MYLELRSGTEKWVQNPFENCLVQYVQYTQNKVTHLIRSCSRSPFRAMCTCHQEWDLQWTVKKLVLFPKMFTERVIPCRDWPTNLVFYLPVLTIILLLFYFDVWTLESAMPYRVEISRKQLFHWTVRYCVNSKRRNKIMRGNPLQKSERINYKLTETNFWTLNRHQYKIIFVH